MLQVSALFVYPIKSTRGRALRQATVEPCGLADDRRWMLVDAGGTAVTQREAPRLAFVEALPEPDGLRVVIPGRDPCFVPRPPREAARVTVRIWGDRVPAAPAPGDVHAAFSAFLGQPVRLVHLPGDVVRPVDPAYAVGADRVSFADGFPLLLASEASLAELNRRLPDPLPMDRFRPNLVVAGGRPFEEDTWKKIRAGEVTFHVVKPCARCVVTTIDQQTGLRGKEPLRTLATFRRREGKVLFGQNLIPEGPGVVRVGDRVEVLHRAG
ncbi:MAG: molybdenum cofactor biosynthesis protein [Rhodothermaceae bacterium]|nr:MAG: molybdenum cofactor biosynthesis protein [Rhodothermaceae bacterium]